MGRKRRKNKKNSNMILSAGKFFVEHCKLIIYALIFVVGVSCIASSFCTQGNWSNVLCGIGTGIFTSLFVTVIVNAENDAREKRKLEREKHFLLNSIIETSLDVYEDVIYRINEFISLSDLRMQGKYKLYQDFKPFNEFADYLKTLNLDTLSDEEKKRLDKLFNFRNYRIDHLISEIKHLPKQEYFLRGLLSQKEYDTLVSQHANDSYLSYAEHIEDFWEDGVLDLPKCIQFLRMTVYITSRTISSFDYAVNKAKNKEIAIEEDIAQLYFDEVYSKSEEYIQSQIEKGEKELEYYASHPEEAEALEQQYEEYSNRTEEDCLLEELANCFFGFEQYDITHLLKKLDKESDKVQQFFKQEQACKVLKKNRKLRRAISKCYGKSFLKGIGEQLDD